MIRVNEIFESICGEAGFFPQGSWCTFIRFQGCNLKCAWCDTKKSQDPSEGTVMHVDHVLRMCNTVKVILTGGEPLLQGKSIKTLTDALWENGHEVQIETNGSILIPPEMYNNYWVVDYKCWSSEHPKVHTELNKAFEPTWRGMLCMYPYVKVKFVIACRADADEALKVMKQLTDCGYSEDFIVSPVGANGSLIDWLKTRMYEYTNRIIFSLQIHKLIGMP